MVDMAGNGIIKKRAPTKDALMMCQRLTLSLRRIEITQQEQVARHPAATECDVIIRGKQQVLQRKHRNRLKLDRQFLHDLLGHLTLDLLDRKSTRLNSSHGYISYAVFCLK